MTGPPGPYGPPGYKGEKVNKNLFVVTILLKHFVYRECAVYMHQLATQ